MSTIDHRRPRFRVCPGYSPATMRRVVPFLLLASIAPACHEKTAADPTVEPPENVLIVMVDTLRADHMSTYGFGRRTTPFIDGFSEGAVVFERARSQASCTFPSVNSLLTSRYPGIFTVQEK